MSRKKVLILCAVVLGMVLTSTIPAHAAGKEKVLHRFKYENGAWATSTLVLDGAGNLYGTTAGGGSGTACGYEVGCGTVFELSPSANGKWKSKVLHNFTGGKDGASPMSGLILDAAGNLYGSASGGGKYNSSCQGGCGVVFELTPSANGKWTEKVLHAFAYEDGYFPYASLVFDTAGNLYGTTLGDGSKSGDSGTAFQLTPVANGKWNHRVLHWFGYGGDGIFPYAGLIFDAAGNLYGTTTYGGFYYGGTVFRLEPGANGRWTERILHSFGNYLVNDGYNPYAGLALDGAGNLYGTTTLGGSTCSASGDTCGTVFRLTLGAKGKWTERVLHSFNSDSASPFSGLVIDAVGNLYGTTVASSEPHGFGTVFELTPHSDGEWSKKLLHVFRGDDGADPFGGLVFDSAANLYGVTRYGGDDDSNCNQLGGCGVVYEITP